MTKITADRLARGAFVYVRQSTPDQLVHNEESRRRQYGLGDRARQLGWGTVEIIDDDLGRSGGGIARPGFERLLAAICEARVGAVFAIEASRLARNGRDWHTLIEFCGLVTSIAAPVASGRGVCRVGLTPTGKRRLSTAHAKSGHYQSYSITLSAIASSVGGTSRPRALAVLRLMRSSYLAGACTGRSAGFSPFRMRPYIEPTLSC
jgi:hypothetical protein